MNLNNERGYTLSTVLLVVLVLTILGGAYLVVLTSEARQSIVHSDRVQAYYHARSGAEAASEWVIANQEIYFNDSVPGTKYVYGDLGQLKFEENSIENPNKDVYVKIFPKGEFEGDDGYEILIEASGFYKDSNEKVSLLMKRQDLFDKAVFANSDIDVNHVLIYIDGDVESKGQVFARMEDGEIVNITGDVFEFSEKTYSSPTPEEDLTEADNPILNIGNNTVYGNKEGDYEEGEEERVALHRKFEKISTGPNGKLIIETNGDNIFIEVNEVEVKGDVVIEGGGTVIMYIHDGGYIRTAGTQAGNFVILLADDADLDIRTPGTSFYGYVYGPGATISMGANPGGGEQEDFVDTVFGAIIVNEISQSSRVWTLKHVIYEDFDQEYIDTFIKRKLTRNLWK